MFGIRTDTQNFLTAKSVDYESAAILARHFSIELIRTLIDTPVGRPFINTLASALESRQSRTGLVIAWAVPLPAAGATQWTDRGFPDPRRQDVAVIVYGCVEDYLVGSMRRRIRMLKRSGSSTIAVRIFQFQIDCGGRTFRGLNPTSSSRTMTSTPSGNKSTSPYSTLGLYNKHPGGSAGWKKDVSRRSEPGAPQLRRSPIPGLSIISLQQPNIIAKAGTLIYLPPLLALRPIAQLVEPPTLTGGPWFEPSGHQKPCGGDGVGQQHLTEKHGQKAAGSDAQGHLWIPGKQGAHCGRLLFREPDHTPFPESLPLVPEVSL